MVDAARRHFTYLADSRASVSVITGDGRLALEAAIAAHTSELPPGAERAWSDDYSNIVRSLRAPGVIVRQE
jgi:hypothetical protein